MGSFTELNIIPAIVFYFMAYSFLGWLLENSFSFITGRPFFKANFLKGPFKPMYGFAPVLLLLLIKPETGFFMIILLCFFIPTAVEYISGWLLDRFFHLRFWDYSNLPLQFKGYICLSFSTAWVFLSIFCLTLLHPLLENIYGIIESVWFWICPSVILYFFADFALALKRHAPKQPRKAKEPNPV